MSGIGLVLNVAKDALLSQQYAIDVTSHNIANASTEGYSRQTAVLTTKQAAPYGGFIFGRGVELQDIVRNTNAFLEQRLQNGQSDLNSVSEQNIYMSVIESMFSENSGQSLSTQLDAFWNSWNDLSNNPSGIPERNSLVESATLLSQTFKYLYNDLSKTSNQINNSIKAGVDGINSILTKIADINSKITAVETTGNANDLRDQRNQLVTELSKYIDVNTYEYDDGNLVVSTGKGYPLVSRKDTYPLNYDGGRIDWQSSVITSVDITDTIDGGKMGGWLELRDQVVPEYMTNLDEIAKSIIWEVNKIHSQGVGLEGFSSTTGAYQVLDSDAAIGSASSGLVYSDKITDGSFKLWLYDNNGSPVGSADITVDADTTSLNDLAAQIRGLSIGGVDALNAEIKDGKLFIGIDAAHSGYSFAFSDDTSSALSALGVNTFFRSSGARDIAINDSILSDKNNIAAARINNNVGPAVGADGNISTGIITTGGPYTGAADGTYEIEITSPMDFQWRKDGGAWTAGVAIGSSVALGSEGVSVNFNGAFVAGDSYSVNVEAQTGGYGEFSSGDNTNTLAIADLQDQNVTMRQWSYSGEGGPTSDNITGATLDECIHTFASSIGIKSQSAQREEQYKQTIQDQLNTTRDNVSGVSLDEEMANLIKFQQAYTAAAKLITTSQEMLSDLLNSINPAA
jgi:flagellar hook-associated protein 1 FlgK